jgi:glycosyltransferase involved in cell wall biosynthesis
MMTAPRDVEAMAAAVTALLRDRDMAGRMGEAGKERAAALFGLEANTRRLEEELVKAAGERRGARRGRDIS